MEPLNHRMKSRIAGFTLVEATIATTILGLILGAIGLTALRGKENFRQGMTVAMLDARAERLLDRIADEVRYAGRDSLPVLPLPPAGSATIEFRACAGYDGGATLWTTRTSIARVADPRDPEDGIDNDGDGVVDEGQVVLTRNLGDADEIGVVIGGGVRRLLQGEDANVLDDNGNGLTDERGLSFVLDGTSSLTIRLSLEALDPSGLPMVRTVQTTVSMRN